jgi:hypothetical protein
MTTNRIFACALGTAIAACAPRADAVNLNPLGTGQVLIYPYYTVNAHQQTLVSVVNTAVGVGRVVKVRFREAYNGRAVLDFNLYLSPADVWTANVFALSDAGVTGDGAALFTTDNSCTDPPLTASGTLGNGSRYLRFSNGNYTGASADLGPANDTRTREGHVEMILMSDILPGSALFTDIRHVNSVPPRCVAAPTESAAAYAAPTANPATGASSTIADGGLWGSASIVDVFNGVFYAYNADALDGFSYVSLYTPPGDAQPTLASVNDRDNPQAATAHVFASGETISATYPGTASGSRKVDAVSAVFAMNAVQNEYIASANQSVGTDWVLTLPTKHLYVDAQPGGAIAGAATAFAPFDKLFGAEQACMQSLDAPIAIFDREENTTTPSGCGFICPPPVRFPGQICLETNVFPIAFSASQSVLGSLLVSLAQPIRPIGSSGWISFQLSDAEHLLNPAGNGNVFHGLPVTGFAAIKFVNGAVPTSGGSALANYSAAYRHRGTIACTTASGGCQ